MTFTFWLAVGGAFARENVSTSKVRVPGIVLAAAGALVLRSIVYNAPNARAATSSEFWGADRAGGEQCLSAVAGLPGG